MPPKDSQPSQRRRQRERDAIAQVVAKRDAEDYFSPSWLMLFATFVVITLIFYVFTPYTHQLDELKNMFLYSMTPILLGVGIIFVNFRKMSWRTHGAMFLFGLFVLAQVISLLFNPEYALVGERVLWFQLACATFTAMFAWFMDSEVKLRKTMMFFVLLSLGSVIVGLFMFANWDFTNQIYLYMKKSPFWLDRYEWITLFYTLKESKDMYSTILNEDFYAAYLVMAIPIVLSMFFVEEHLLFKAIALLTFLLMNVCLVFTFSNDSFMSMIILYAVYLILGYHSIRKHISGKTLLTLLIGGFVVAATAFILSIPKLHQVWDFKTEALEGRSVLWLGGFWPWLFRDDITMTDLNWRSILFGTGPGGYRFYFPLFRRPDYFDNQINNVTTFGHNYYLDILLEFGLLGFLCFILFYGRVLYDGVRQVLKTGNDTYRFYQLSMVAGLSGIALQNFFSPNNRWAVCGMIFYAFFGISMGIWNLDHPGKVPEDETKKRMVPLMTRIALALLALIFVFRSTPQGFRYFAGAMANNRGLQYMGLADDYSAEDKEKLLLASREEFEDAIKLNPTFATTYYKLAHVYNQLRMLDTAIKTYERLNQINPHYSEIHLNLGIMYFSKADAVEGEERIETLEKAYAEIREAARQELKPQVQWYAGVIGDELAMAYEAAGETEKALKVYDEIRENYHNILTYQPKLYGEIQDRKKYYKPAQRAIIKLAYLSDKLQDAEEVLETMYRENPEAPEYLSALLAFFDTQKKTKEKVEFLERATQDAPTDPRIRKLLAAAYREMNAEDKYRRELKKIEVLDPDDRAAMAGLYLSYKKDGAADQAAQYEERLKKAGLDPEKITTQSVADAMDYMEIDSTAAALLAVAAAEPEEDEADERTTTPVAETNPAKPETTVAEMQTTPGDTITSAFER